MIKDGSPNTIENRQEKEYPFFSRSLDSDPVDIGFNNETAPQRSKSYGAFPVSLESKRGNQQYKQLLKKKMKQTFEKFLSKSSDDEEECSCPQLLAKRAKKGEKILDASCIYNLPEFLKDIEKYQGLAYEYGTLESLDRQLMRQSGTFLTGRKNETKNRFTEYLPNETTRIKLKMGQCDYINANMIEGNKFSPQIDQNFIATQAPIQQSFDQFWVMIVEHQVKQIVVLADRPNVTKKKSFFSLFSSVVESTSEYLDSFSAQCDKYSIHQYWPDKGKQFVFADRIYVKNISETHHRKLHLTVRQFEIFDVKRTSPDGSPIKRIIYQYHYTAWPDMAIPSSEKQIASLIDHMHQHDSTTDSPMVVHCLAGVGRTGTFIATVVAFAQLQKQLEAKDEITTSIYNVVHQLKQSRSGMVQQIEQYRFIYKCLLYRHKKLKVKYSKTPNAFLQPIVDDDDADDDCPSTPLSTACPTFSFP
mmetsp:Transcript_11898/g.17689  ORF Transcript_11898/g.17689 Transcript_11898/m.17689 type:complete len:474 (+) Transcript_11898:769-2190(+)